MNCQDLISHLDETLNTALYRDYCPNGLQIQGKPDIQKLITGVSANARLFDEAIRHNADAVLVHHGLFWKGTPQPITGLMHQRIKRLFDHDINLIAYHLPLDAHPTYGNNAQLAKSLDFKVEKTIDLDNQPDLLMLGGPASPISGKSLKDQLQKTLNYDPMYIEGKASKIKRIAWCTGAAHSYLPMMEGLGVDAYITGEYSLAMVEYAQEAGIHFYAAGHHATEQGGVIALGDHLSQKFDLDVQFIDIPNPA